MARRILNKSSAGTGATFGSDDTDYINKLLTGEDQSAEDPVDISTTFKIRNAKLHISNAGNDNVSIIQSAASGGNKTITLPDLTGTAAVTTGAQTFEDKTIAFGDNTLTDVASTNTAQTLTEKTIAFGDNTLTNVASTNTAQTLTEKTIAYGDNTLTDVASTNTAQTLENKTIAYGDNTLTDVASTNTAQTLTEKTIDARNNTLLSAFLLPDVKFVGGYVSNTTVNNGGFGFISISHISAPGGGTQTVGNRTTDPTYGFYTPFTTGAITENNAGNKTSSGITVRRQLNCRYKVRWRMTGSPTPERAYLGLYAHNNTISANTPSTSIDGIMLGYLTTDTNYMIMHSSGDNDWTFTATSNITIPKTNTDVHTLEIQANESAPNFQVSIDGTAFQTITTPIPTATADLRTHQYIYTTADATRSFDMFYWYVEMDNGTS